jgi:hypothetical protein
MESVSVIVPFYGSFDTQRLKLAAESIFSQKGVNIELIIGGNNQATKITPDTNIETLKDGTTSKNNSMGRIINRALRTARSDFVYISDADILFRSPAYLLGLVKESLRLGTALKRPSMRRLLLEDFEDFQNLATSFGLAKTISGYDTSQNYVIKPRGANRQIRVFTKYENGRNKVFIASEKDFQEYIGSKTNKGLEPKFFNQDRHCGATFAPTKALNHIGGYCEEFISWGVWDADVQWKLESTIGMSLIPEKEMFEVIHLDHLKGYFNSGNWEIDKSLQKIRRNQGHQKSIDQDKLIYQAGTR